MIPAPAIVSRLFHVSYARRGRENRADKVSRRESVARASGNVPIAEANSSRFLWQAIAVSATALLVRLAYIFEIRRSPFFAVLIGDARRYDAWAREIAAGDWLGREVFYQAPLYPYFLGAMYASAGRDLLLVRICQALIGTAACVLLALAGRALHGKRVGLLAGLALAVYAPAMFFDGLLQKSTLDLFLVSVLLLLVAKLARDPDRRSYWFALGLALGGLALTRENALMLIVPIVLWHLRMSAARAPRTGWVSMLAFGAALLVVLLPVAVRNRVVGGEWHLTTSQFGPNLYLGNNANADGTASALREGRGSAEYERQDATALAQAATGRRLTPGGVSTFWTKQALAFVRSNPSAWVRLEARKMALLWNRAELIDTESQYSYEDWSVVLRTAALVGHFGVLAPLALLGVMVGWPDRERLWLCYAMAATYAASVLMFYVSSRYRLPLVPFLLLFAAAGLVSLPGFIRDSTVARKGGTAALVGAMVLFANWPILSADSMRAVTENNLGNALQTDGRFREAALHYTRALDMRPDYTPACINLGEALLAQGQPDEAVAAFRRASALPAIEVDLDGKIGNALLRAGRPLEAIDYFRRSLAATGGSAEIDNNLIAALVATNRQDEAIPVFRRALERDPRNGELHFRLGTLLLERGDFAEAVPEFRAGLSAIPDSPEGHGNLGAALAASGRTDEAIAEFEEALRLNPGLVSARRNLQVARGAAARETGGATR